MAENKRPSPANIICIDLTESDDDEGCKHKRVRKKLKTGKAPPLAVDFDDVEILDPKDMVQEHSTTVAAASSTNNDDDGDDIAVVGTKNHVRLPHMRQHCTEKPFAAANSAVNQQTCDCCYCFVCDVPVKECKTWNEDHCHATNNGPQSHIWKARRQAAKKKPGTKKPTPKVVVPTGPHMRDACTIHQFLVNRTHLNLRNCPSCVCYVCDRPARACSKWSNAGLSSHCNATANDPIWTRQRDRKRALLGAGPFPPTQQGIADATGLTQCGHCSWWSRFRHKNFAPNRRLNPLGCLDWCHACGQVASDRDLGKKQSTRYVPQTADFLLGTKEMPFTLRIHDPRNMQRFRQRWKDNADSWTYDENVAYKEVFCHRLGDRPDLSTLLASVPILDDIPTDGNSDSSTNLLVSADETQAVLFDDPHHFSLLKQIHSSTELFGQNTGTLKRHPYNWLHGGLQAEWDEQTRSGILRVTVYIRSQILSAHPPHLSPTNMAQFLGLWFGVLPLTLEELQLPLKAKIGILPRDFSSALRVDVPPFKLGRPAFNEKLKASRNKEQVALVAFNARAQEVRTNRFALKSSTGSWLAGGICGTETDLRGMLKRFCRETAVECIARDGNLSDTSESAYWFNQELGVNSNHRSMRKLYDTGVTSSDLTMDPFDLSSYLSREENALLRSTSGDARTAFQQVNSLKGLMNHLENRGHAAAPFVEGLKIELLPFQLQSLQWAIERETTPGGVQSFFNIKLPGTQIYYNPALAKISSKIPNLVRGGIIAEQMGLGKTVISLALILQNPAPVTPATGSAVALVQAYPATTNNGPFWDPNLYGRTSETKKKRGSIVSRGTLVVCNVSLVGQWIEEAKSKLKDPGLIYSYHGSSRTRNSKKLAKNAIVVTTYETLASDQTYHAKNQDSASYVSPCEQVRWWRVICDESHVLRNANSGKSRAVMALSADNRWLVSGTPISMTVDDLRNQLAFLGIEDSGEMMNLFRRSFYQHINDKQGGGKRRSHDDRIPGLGIFSFLMRSIMIRHGQKQKYRASETTLMSLPPKTERIEWVDFSEEERSEYDVLETSARAFYQSYEGGHGKNYLALSQQLIPLRIACSGGQLPLDSVQEAGDEEEPADDVRKKKEQQFSKHVFKSKLLALVSELKRVRENDTTAKSLVFSQYTSTVKFLQTELPKHGFQFRSLSGDMSMSQRAKALRDFQCDPPTTVFILSMRAGAVGINLTQANCVFLMEPCFNPALEAQAIGRVHRLGQKRPVTIVRLLMKDSVETRIREMLEKKYGSSEAPGHNVDNLMEVDGGGDGESESDKKPAAKNPVGKQALVGSIASDKAVMLKEEFDLLFGVDSASSPPSEPPAAAAAAATLDTDGGGGAMPDEATSGERTAFI